MSGGGLVKFGPWAVVLLWGDIKDVTNIPRKGRQTAVRRSRSRTPEDASLTQHEPSLAQRAVADMYEEARDPIWQACTPSPLVKDSDDEDGGIEAEWAEEE